MYKLLTEREGNFGNYHPSKTNVNVGFASVDIDGRIKNSNAFEAISFYSMYMYMNIRFL